MQLDTENVEGLQRVLLEGQLCVTFLNPEDISKEILSEKLSDYFEKVEINFFGVIRLFQLQ